MPNRRDRFRQEMAAFERVQKWWKQHWKKVIGNFRSYQVQVLLDMELVEIAEDISGT